jgi:hypothetical protein
MSMKRGLLVLLAVLALAPAAEAGGPTMAVGAAEDNVRQMSPTAAKAQMDLVRLLGLNAVRVTTTWTPGTTAPSAGEANILSNVDQAATLTGMRVVVQVMNAGSRTTPRVGKDQSDFAAYAAAIARRFPTFRDFIVGNEPNLNRFWLPQFGPDGENLAAQAYEPLLAQTYDALKSVSPLVQVYGGALSPRGEDKANSVRQTHSPTQFILDMGTAYRGSGRTTPIMDGFAIHPYEDNSSLPPSSQHPRTTTIAVADYGKLVSLLGQAFDGTAQPGSQLPLVYGEFGVESQIPPDQASRYTGTEPVTTKPVTEETQAQYYRDALAIAFCQPNVKAFFFFHTADEQALDRWQSGLFYVDGSAKSSMKPVAAAVRDTRGGVITKCEGLALTPVPSLKAPRPSPSQKTMPIPVLTCDIDCTYRVRLEKLPAGATVAAVYGKVQARTPLRLPFRQRRLAPGEYRFTARAVAPVNVGPPGTAATKPFRIR